MVDLAGYVVILVETPEKRIKLYGSPADHDDLEIGDEIVEVNGRNLEGANHTEILSHIHQCIRSRVICLRVKRKTGSRRALNLEQSTPNVQNAFVIAVEEQAKERLERLSALKRIKPVDMTQLSQQLNQLPSPSQQEDWNGFIERSPIYVLPSRGSSETGEGSSTTTAYVDVHAPSLTNGLTAATGAASTSTSATYADPSGGELELKQDLRTVAGPSTTATAVTVSSASTAPGVTASATATSSAAAALAARRASSPFTNGRTELLLPAHQDAAPDGGRLRSASLAEPFATPLPDDEATSSRPRRSIVATPTGKEEVVECSDYVVNLAMLGPEHREMAVDVPDSFIARSKTPPRYPPPRPARVVAPTTAPTQPPMIPPMNGSAAKPVPPPRDHLRIEKDGRLVNRAPAPQLPARPPEPPLNNEPTREQMDSIKKYQEALRRRKEDEERRAQQAEFLNGSLRSSTKLQALQERQVSGIVNDAFSTADEALPSTPSPPPIPHLHRIVGNGEVVASLERLRLKVANYCGLDTQVAAVQTLLSSPAFARALDVHNTVQQVWSSLQRVGGPQAAPVTSDAAALVRNCLDAIQPSSSPEAAELADLLTRYEVEGLIYAHDKLASNEVTVLMATPAPASLLSADGDQPYVPPALQTAALPDAQDDGQNIKIIEIEKSNEPLGATVRNEGDAVLIGRVVRGGVAEKSGLLHEGDEILEVNGVQMRGKSVNEVCDILAGMKGTLTFLVVPAPNTKSTNPPQKDTLMHVRALFDYDPEDDRFIPCRELGVSFQKGDVLHVISQEDENWWQAYREGEEDQALAGLIPSKSFQQQREQLKQAIPGDKSNKEKPRKVQTLLCAKRNQKKKKKKSPHNAYTDGSYPLYSSSTTDDYDSEEILTYEEVALYYPRANHKRPVVLIGPPNIGRHELRQRLMEDSERFAAAIPHTSRARKDNEVDGQDYHFISRTQFEADILGRKFVEHGEYERAYYGTSLDAIRSVVNSGKICVLNLHPQSLRILRNSDLKPYVVLVAPPPLDKLRQKKIRSGEAYREEELKDIIEKAREMEEKYGHLLDLVIINNDTERAFSQLLTEINRLEREQQWVPLAWVKQP